MHCNLFNRALVGIGAGLGICVGPIYLSEIAPPRIRGSVGTSVYLLCPAPRGMPTFVHRSFNPTIDRAWYHAHASYGALPCYPAAMEICSLHFVGDIYSPVLPRRVDRRVSVLLRYQELGRRSEIRCAKTLG